MQTSMGEKKNKKTSFIHVLARAGLSVSRFAFASFLEVHVLEGFLEIQLLIAVL